ncbi:MAG TPA: hypothetical protein VFR37_19465 [Longimicrobium sp.]|nr:hypothetical protein [Longimicrobium sp.]
MRGSRWLPVAAVALFAAGFAWLNRGERVAVDVGVATFYRAPLTVVFFLAFLAGMLSMLALSLRQDLRMRDELRARGLLDVPPSATPPPAAAEWSRPREAPVEPAPAPAGEDERTLAYPRFDDGPAAVRDQDDRTVAYPRYDGEPAD